MKVSLEDLSLYNSHIPPTKEKPPQTVGDLMVDQDKVCVFFYGVSRENGVVSGMGFVLHLLVNYYLNGKANLNNGTNNMGEFSALFTLLKVTLKRNTDNFMSLVTLI